MMTFAVLLWLFLKPFPLFIQIWHPILILLLCTNNDVRSDPAVIIMPSPSLLVLRPVITAVRTINQSRHVGWLRNMVDRKDFPEIQKRSKNHMVAESSLDIVLDLLNLISLKSFISDWISLLIDPWKYEELRHLELQPEILEYDC